MQEHRKIVDFTVEHYKAASMFQKNVINAINLVSTKILAGDTPPDIDYTSVTALKHLEKLTEQEYKQALGKIYIDINDVDWNLTPASTKVVDMSKVDPVSQPKKKSEIVQEDTPKEYLYLKAPKYPRLDTNKVVLDDIVGGERFYIHPSLPIIPEKQCDVSCTTDVNKMTTKDLLKLFPNHLIRTRSAVMYEPCGDIPMDKDLGLLLPIEGFTPEQVRDNIIKYPHFYKLSRLYNDQEYNLYGHIEIDGELHEITEVWNNLPISKLVPATVEFAKEYVIRRYLLERDNGVEHKFPMRGTLMPYLTLFAPSSFYNEDPAKLARSCVEARVSFFKSRNPYLERYEDVKQGLIPPNVSNTCPFKAYCRGTQCLHICPKVSEFEYLLERNNLLGNKNVYSYSPKMLQKALEYITSADGCYKVVISDDPADTASCLTYVAICNHYVGNTFHCSVYHLNFMEYINKLQQSWGMSAPDDDLEYTQIFIEKCKVLVVSNIDYVQFKDFHAQTLLNMAHNRKLHNQTTLVVSPDMNRLIGSGPFFIRMKEVFGKELIK